VKVGDLVKSLGNLSMHYDDGTRLRTSVDVGIIIDVEHAVNEDAVVCVHWHDSECEWILDKELVVLEEKRK
tara:strand:- start:239 stop:451 length:213 start_codon:yes stop_codon:yes gene_type:complete